MDETLERIFMDYLSEIQKSYVNLSKSLRLRVERWCEKLVNAGNLNKAWQKSRNDFTKLLLGMVISGKFSEPFHNMPPDGPLGTFPTYLKSKLKEALGPHESFFWRELFNKIEDNSIPTKKNINTESKSTSNNPFTAKNSVNPLQGELQSLNMLVREQEERIEILEKQLRDERISHELELQRLIYSHRIELSKLNTQKTKSSPHLSTNLTSSPKQNSYSTASSNVFISNFPKSVDESYNRYNNENAFEKNYDKSFESSNYPFESNDQSLFKNTSDLFKGSDGNIVNENTEEDEFFNYLEKFQEEIKIIQSTSKI